MTAIHIAAQHIAAKFYDLDSDCRAELDSDDGIQFAVDVESGAIRRWFLGEPEDDPVVTVWYRPDDHKIVSFTNSGHPAAGEEWAEVDGPERRYHVFVSDAVATGRTSANTSPWSVDPMTRDELVRDIVDNLNGVDLDWTGNEATATITNPNTDERERVIFVLDPA